METKDINETERQAAVPYFIHEGDMTRMDMAMDKLLTANRHMKEVVRLVCFTLIAVVLLFVIGYTINNCNWIKYAETLQTEGAGHEQQTEIHELPDPGADP